MSIPVATNVTIIGEAVAGAVVRGSYFTLMMFPSKTLSIAGI